MLGTENMIVEMRDPLLPRNGGIEVIHGHIQMTEYVFPEKGWILVNQVSWRCVSELPIHANFLKLAIQCVCLSGIKWVSQLAD